MRSSLRYQKADSLFFNEPIWRAVSEQERREIFRDMTVIVLEREEKSKKDLHERNVRALADILDGIEEVTHRTTWAQAQRILIENPDFANDSILQGIFKIKIFTYFICVYFFLFFKAIYFKYFKLIFFTLYEYIYLTINRFILLIFINNLRNG